MPARPRKQTFTEYIMVNFWWWTNADCVMEVQVDICRGWLNRQKGRVEEACAEVMETDQKGPSVEVAAEIEKKPCQGSWEGAECGPEPVSCMSERQVERLREPNLMTSVFHHTALLGAAKTKRNQSEWRRKCYRKLSLGRRLKRALFRLLCSLIGYLNNLL
jgi:hypothetical protein